MKALKSLVLLVALVTFTACGTHTHVVGSGPNGGGTSTKRQWYFLFGLVPLNKVNTQTMAKDENYKIKTEIGPADFFLNIITSFVTINSRTVKVED